MLPKYHMEAISHTGVSISSLPLGPAIFNLPPRTKMDYTWTAGLPGEAHGPIRHTPAHHTITTLTLQLIPLPGKKKRGSEDRGGRRQKTKGQKEDRWIKKCQKTNRQTQASRSLCNTEFETLREKRSKNHFHPYHRSHCFLSHWTKMERETAKWKKWQRKRCVSLTLFNFKD